jgi:oxygen-dependent protoporphyrinogen oxidase
MAAAHALVTKTPAGELPAEVRLFEASGRLGGTIETVSEGGFTIECGPDSWVTERSATRELAAELGLADQIICSNDAVRRTYLASGNALTAMPEGMRMMVPTRWLPILESPLFSWQARLAYLREPRRAEEFKALALSRPDGFDESVRDFVVRHFGEEATETIAGPLLAGVFGGDIRLLSAGAVLAQFVRLEREHGSLIAPMMQRAQQTTAADAGAAPIFTTLRDGLGLLIDAIARILPSKTLRLRTPVEGLRPAGQRTGLSTGPRDGWVVSSAAHGEEQFDAVVVATPADVTRALLAPMLSEAAELLEMEATSAIVAALCWDADASQRLRVPRGFGFLVPPVQALGGGASDPHLLAGTFMHQKFDHRAPAGAVFLRGYFGGSSALQMEGWSDERIAEVARERFARLLGPLPAASYTVVRRWPRSLPQYRVGHVVRMQVLEKLIDAMPGLALAGNAYKGVGLSAVVEQAQVAAAHAWESGARHAQ